MSKLSSPLTYAALTGAIASASVAYSLGLGEASVNSRLGQPLDAKIPLNKLDGLSEQQLLIKVKPVWDEVTGTAMGGVDPRELVVETSMDNGETGLLRLRSRQPLMEPFLNFIVTVRWPDGVIAREYTLLLDLPTSLPTNSAARVAEQGDGNRSVPSGVSAAVTPAENLPSDSAAGRADFPAAPAPAPRLIASEEGRYVTRRGDNLWLIASRLGPVLGGPIKQRMAQVYAANPQAFVGGDPTALKEQVVLDVRPSVLSRADTDRMPVAAAPSSSRTPAPAPRPQTTADTGDGSRGGGETAPTLSAIRREIADVNEAMAAMSQRLLELQQQLQVLSRHQASGEPVDGASVADSAPDGDDQPLSVEQQSLAPSADGVLTEEQLTEESVAEEPVNDAPLTSALLTNEPGSRTEETMDDVGPPDSAIEGQADTSFAADSAADVNADQYSEQADTVEITAADIQHSEQQADVAPGGRNWLGWLLAPCLALLALVVWRRRGSPAGQAGNDRAAANVAVSANNDFNFSPDRVGSVASTRPVAPAPEAFSDVFDTLARDHGRDLPGTTSDNVRQTIDPRRFVQAPAARETPSTDASANEGAFKASDFAAASGDTAREYYDGAEDALADLDFDDIDLDGGSGAPDVADLTADTADTAERAAACMALADYDGARTLLETALVDGADVALQLQLLDVYAAQGESAEFEALALQMEFAGVDDNTLSEIQLVRDKLTRSHSNDDYNGYSA